MTTKIYNDLTKLIGNTPLVKLTKLSKSLDLKATLIAKLEYFNPGGSVKDRIALAMIEAAEEKKLLKPDGVIIEPTSGNTGIGLSWIGAIKGYKVILVMPETMSIERRQLLQAYGAELILTDGALGMKGAIAKAEELAYQLPNAFMPKQFENPANPSIHALQTAKEIWEDTQGQVDIIIGGVGTGGTISGISKTLKSLNPTIQSFAVEPFTSAVLSGENPGKHKIQGIGAGFVPANYNSNLIDGIIKVKEEEAKQMCITLAKTEGVLVGISSGAALVAATQQARKAETTNKQILVILPDTGERYLSTGLFDIEH